MPELIGLRRRTLGVAVPHRDKRRRRHIANEINRRAARIDRGIVIHRRPKIRDHPLVDQILAVVTLPVRNPRARDRGAEAMRLRHRPHGHVAAITPAGDSQTLGIDRQKSDHLIDTQQNVAQIALAEVLNVILRERLARP